MKKLIIFISVPRSGTNYFFNQMKEIKMFKINAYYELFNDSFYNKSECWDDFYKKYNCKNKLKVLDKLLNYGNGLQKPLNDIKNSDKIINIIKIFPNQLNKDEFIELINNKNYNIKLMFLLRDMKDVYQSYYHALTYNDWTMCRKDKLKTYKLDEMLKNKNFKYNYENKIFECYLNDMVNIIKYFNKSYTFLYFKDFKNYSLNDFEKIILNEFNIINDK